MTHLLLELNEINFDDVERYGALGKLPTLNRMIRDHGVSETSSEREYAHLEPWIQWVTAHTGQSLGEHGVFRLGDIVGTEIPQIWESLEAQGLTVGAISPMNAKNRCESPAFFVPDPWTSTPVSGSPLLRKLYAAIAQVVNDNASARLTAASAAWLLAGLAAYARPVNWIKYLGLFRETLRRKSWTKSLILDQLLADIFVRQVTRSRPDFASLFLNAGAHIQHHYMFNSAVYSGSLRNPEWYVSRTADPVLEVYELYDRIVGQIREAFPSARLILATGLHQVPHGKVTFYWRLKDHADFLRKRGISFARVEPRMSRDFVVFCESLRQGIEAEAALSRIIGPDGTPLFIIDNRGDTLFVMLGWPHDIGPDFVYQADGAPVSGLRQDVAFVAIKNGEHSGIGYLIDTAESASNGNGARTSMPLRDLPGRIAEGLGASFASRPRPAIAS